MMCQIKIRYYGLASLSLHCIILIVFALGFSSREPHVNDIPAIPITLYQSQAITHKPKQLIVKNSLLHVKKTVTTNSKHSSQIAYNRSHSMKKINSLLQQLHNAIATQQHYPENLPQEETVTLSMLVSPDGKLSQLKVLHSSGDIALDDSVLQAAEDASPISGIKGLLPVAQFFSVNITFA